MNQIVIITGWVKTGMIDKPIEKKPPSHERPHHPA